ncbi:MAG: retropepsin-like aspartic protease [Cyanobium sp.]
MPNLIWLLLALIQVRGQPLAAGTLSGGTVVPLERAAGGDTPVLTLAGPHGVLRLLLDTGASSSMVTPQAAARLGLMGRPLAGEELALAGGGNGCDSLRPGRTRLPLLTMAGSASDERLEIRGLDALILPAGALPAGIDGVLGAPSLRQSPVWIDPVRGSIAFGGAALRAADRSQPRRHPTNGSGDPPTGTDPIATAADAGKTGSFPPRAAQTVPLEWRKGVPVLRLNLPGRAVQALADTGAEGLFVSGTLAAMLPGQGEELSLRLVGFCGEQSVTQRPVTGLSLTDSDKDPQQKTAKPQQVIVTSNPIFAALGVEAIVGQELLRSRIQLWRLELDPPLLELR